MIFLKRITIAFHVVSGMFLIGGFAVFLANKVPFQTVVDFLYWIYSDPEFKAVFACIAAFFVVMNYLLFRLFTVNSKDNRVIEFQNPSGTVSVSLFALEEMAKRVMTRVPEVKDVRTNIDINKKGLKLKSKLILRSEASVPEITSRVQDLIKQKIQDTIGLDEEVDVSIHVTKILPEKFHEPVKTNKDKESDDDSTGPNIPFQGYRA